MNSRGTFLKLVVLVLAFGLIGASILSMRQRRLQAISDMTEAQRRVLAHDRTLWELRAEIGSRVAPDHVRTILSRAGGRWSEDGRESEGDDEGPTLAYLGDDPDAEASP